MASRIISISYGHGSPSGKLYDYETDKQYRKGDVVVVPVEHYKSHKLYNTLGVVQLTTNEDTPKWNQKADHLTDPENDIKPKNVNKRVEIAQAQGFNATRQVSIRTLPGYKTRQTDEKWSGGTASRLISREE
ncbi:MAG: hypothetical protein NC184_05680 [Roseburia sp.]|nr:hypothetical protein [Roseburia sp.]